MSHRSGSYIRFHARIDMYDNLYVDSELFSVYAIADSWDLRNALNTCSSIASRCQEKFQGETANLGSADTKLWRDWTTRKLEGFEYRESIPPWQEEQEIDLLNRARAFVEHEVREALLTGRFRLPRGLSVMVDTAYPNYGELGTSYYRGKDDDEILAAWKVVRQRAIDSVVYTTE